MSEVAQPGEPSTALTLAPTVEIRAAEELLPLFDAYERADTSRHLVGRELGKALAKWRDRYRAQGSRKGRGFSCLLENLHIPRRTAYNLIKKVTLRREPHFVPFGTKSSASFIADIKKITKAAQEKLTEIRYITTPELLALGEAVADAEHAFSNIVCMIIFEMSLHGDGINEGRNDQSKKVSESISKMTAHCESATDVVLRRWRAKGLF